MLEVVPVTVREAAAFIRLHHRHHVPDRGHLFTLAAAAHHEPRTERAGAIVAVAVVGRPKARELQDDFTAEVTRLCAAPGVAYNAASLLLAASWRAARALGYRRLVTYTLAEEGGASLRAAGWECIGQAGGGSWSREGRPRVDLHPTQGKLRWEARPITGER